MQEDYRIKLYSKNNKGGIELTEEGSEFLAYVRRILQEMDALKVRFNHVAKPVTTKPFSVGGTYALASELLPRLLGQFKRTHPELNIVLRTGSSLDIHRQITRGEVEIGLAVKRPDSEHLECQVYGTHQLVAFVHPDHPCARKRELSAADLARGPLVLRGGPRLQSGAEIELIQLGCKPNVAVRCETLEAVRTAVRNKLGIGILSYDTVKNATERGEFTVLRVPELTLQATSFIIYHKERPLSANATDFLILLRENKPKPEFQRKSRSQGENSLESRHRANKGWLSGQAKWSYILTAAIQLSLSQTDFWSMGWF